MIEVGDIVTVDAELDHQEVHSLKADDPSVFDTEGEVLWIEDQFKEFQGTGGEVNTVFTGRLAEVEWDDGEGTGTYSVEILLKAQNFRLDQNNPNKTFKSDRLKRSIDNVLEGLFNGLD